MTTRAEIRKAREAEGAWQSIGDVHELIDEEFELWMIRTGHAVLPELERLHRSLPHMMSAMLTTADGLNLCSLGVEESQVGRLAAMVSSIHAVSTAAASGTLAVHGGQLNAVTMMTGSALAIVIALPHPKFDHLLLWVASGTADRLGGLLVRARDTADRLLPIIPPI